MAPSRSRDRLHRRRMVDSRTAPVVGDRDRPHAAQRIAAIGGAGGHDFRAGWRDDGRDALSVPSPPPAGRRGSRDPEPVDNALGHAAAGLAGRGTGTDVGVTGLAARPRSPSSGTTPPRPAAVAAVPWPPCRPPPREPGPDAAQVINRSRADAHAKEITEEDLSYLRVCFKRMEEHLDL